ncbi:helix-turn-helix domain-containing protein [Alkalicoccus urumqiensis]|uniref:HTH araC/xylS-type domain-containing protein n=1 Tax=Alkalicoccus urumqiensis TaxID=1548213 RepID=A0A2P6MHE7_ALKUR|nr:AraC family transcriptional regulator [Alkalicoccus urumqiensis]PRO65704.1 hypothetical protein C6I21_07325 [Alkalicoccus urumqiensis]
MIRTSIARHERGWSMTEHTHKEGEISVVLSGEPYAAVNGELVRAVPGTVLQFAPGTPHAFQADGRVRFAVLHTEQRIQETSVTYLRPGDAAVYEQLFRRWLMDAEGAEALQHAWMELLCTFASAHASSSHAYPVTVAAEALAEGSGTIGEAAAEAGWSISSFRRRFIEQYGMAPKQYQQLHRLNKAKQLLREGEPEVERIGQELGFQTVHAFSRWFKQQTGMAPTRWYQAQHDARNG